MNLLSHLFAAVTGKPSAEHDDVQPVPFSREVSPNAKEGWHEIWSVGSGPTVLLIHDLIGTADEMGPIAIALAHQGYRAIGLDRPDGGRTGEALTDISELADAIIETAHVQGPIAGVIAHGDGATAVLVAMSHEHFTHDAVLIGVDAHDVPSKVTSELADVRSLLIHSADDDVVPLKEALLVARSWPTSMMARVEGLGHRRILYAGSTLDSVVRFLDTRHLDDRTVQ